MAQIPDCEKYPYVHLKHKHRRIDNYYWLNQRDNPEVLDYLKRENDYTAAYLKSSEKFMEDLFHEMKNRIVEDDQSVPYKKNGYWYQTKYAKGKEYAISTRRKGDLTAKEEIFLDENIQAEGHSYYAVASKSISPNNQWLCFGEDTVGRRLYTLRFKDLFSGEFVGEQIEGTTGRALWAGDNKTVFYTKKDPETLRCNQVWRHTFGTNQDQDVLVYEEVNPEFDCGIYKTKCQTYIVIGSSSSTSTEFHYLPTTEPDAELRLFLPRAPKHEYSLTHYEGNFYMLSNHEGQNFGFYKCDPANPEIENWETIIAPNDNILLESVEIFKDYFVVVERKGGLVYLRVLPTHGEPAYYIPFNDPTYSVDLEVNVEFDTEELRFGYTSLTTPTSIFSYNLRTKEQQTLKQQKVLGEFNVKDYQSERIWAKGKDGVEIPISLVYKKGFKDQKRKPLLLYGYGSYGVSLDPYFSTIRLSLLNRGYCFAIAHIRGGEDLGRPWYENAKWLKKKNTFNDFISCGEHLLETGWVDKDALYAMGGSAGGMLMGTVMNMRPELWAGIVAQVPFVDVVTTMLDESIPLTTGEYEEWGNPNDKEYYDYMLSYSPYDNVEKTNYPPLLVTSGYHDSQVQYWEPTKWVAKLRDYKTDNNPLLLYTEMEAGHGGVSGRFEQLKEVAREYAFLFGLEGIKE
ncbi:S9 family peptidase [Luteibaculum oceani]|uniref:Proline-specific endopeptidase n=1 Tax=Luteibaculum oceani TaxID=1294296 RepID=A0A5C6VII8_9FLAO|nr:S9 family peptidase [Luteibaculum oceani]TXC85382.1 S9 family peptidase [Luteibaculum oceani]